MNLIIDAKESKEFVKLIRRGYPRAYKHMVKLTLNLCGTLGSLQNSSTNYCCTVQIRLQNNKEKMI